MMSLELRDDVTGTEMMSLEHTDEVMMMSPRVIARPKVHFIGASKFSSGGAVLEPRSSVEQMVMTTHRRLKGPNL